jgi:glyoxylase-like metal-dependent hydrolase (beta-lactamase superfamily II)
MSQFAWLEIPDGYMMPQPHAETALGTQKGQSRSSIYLLKEGTALGLIDTGIRNLGLREIIDQIDRQGGDLHWILLTHYHLDHIGNAEALKHSYGCPVIAHYLDVPPIEDPLVLAGGDWGYASSGVTESEIMQELGGERKIDTSKEMIEKYFNFPVKVDRLIDSEETLNLGAWEMQLLHTPGHSPGSLSLFNPESRSLYIGDVDYIMNPSSPWPIGDAANLTQSLNRLISMNAEFLGLGHYDAIYQSWAVREYLEAMLDRCEATERRIQQCLQLHGRLTISELAQEVFPIMPRYGYPPMSKNIVHCFLHKLRQSGIVSRTIRQEKVFWELVAADSDQQP